MWLWGSWVGEKLGRRKAKMRKRNRKIDYFSFRVTIRQFIADGYMGKLFLTSDLRVGQGQGSSFILVIDTQQSGLWRRVWVWSSLIPHGGCMWNSFAFPQCRVCTETRGSATRTEPFFASGIAMETGALFIESLGCSHSLAVYHSVHMLEANGEQFSARRTWTGSFFFFLVIWLQSRHGLCVVLLCSSGGRMRHLHCRDCLFSFTYSHIEWNPWSFHFLLVFPAILPAWLGPCPAAWENGALGITRTQINTQSNTLSWISRKVCVHPEAKEMPTLKQKEGK